MKILVTEIENLEGVDFLSGILLDPILEDDFPKDVFTASLVSDHVRQVVCELPIYEDGIGSTAEGYSVGAFKTRLLGTRLYRIPEQRKIITILSDVASNRIRLVSSSEIRNARLPAFLSTVHVSPPIATHAVVELQVRTISELPEIQAFLSQQPRFEPRAACHDAIKEGMTIPVLCTSGSKRIQSALELRRQLGVNRFDAVIYHEHGIEQPSVGDKLERHVTLQNVRHNESHPPGQAPLRFKAHLGTVTHIDTPNTKDLE
jgi:hypothetical protein